MESADKSKELLAILEHLSQKQLENTKLAGNEKKKATLTVLSDIKKKGVVSLNHYKKEITLKILVGDLTKELSLPLENKDESNTGDVLTASNIIARHYKLAEYDSNLSIRTFETKNIKLLQQYTLLLRTDLDYPDLTKYASKVLYIVMDYLGLLLSTEKSGIHENIQQAIPLYQATIEHFMEFIEACFMDRSMGCFDELISSNYLMQFFNLFQKTSNEVWLRKLLHIADVLGGVFYETNTSKNAQKYLQDNNCLSVIWLGVLSQPESRDCEDMHIQFEFMKSTLDLMEKFKCTTMETHISSYVSLLRVAL